MDLDLAIHRINPAAEYRLTDDKTALIEWRGPGVQPTPAELDGAWAAYQAAHIEAEQAAQQAMTDRQAAIEKVLTNDLVVQAGLVDSFKVILGIS